MAITTDDFNKIWASTSPLTPYSFSESQYKEGWNFIGSTPPSRQMWDFLQKNNDEKMQYLLNNFDNYLPLSGGTVTGDLTVTGALDGTASGNLPLSGGTLTGDVDITGDLFVSGAIYSSDPASGENSGQVPTTAWVQKLLADALAKTTAVADDAKNVADGAALVAAGAKTTAEGIAGDVANISTGLTQAETRISTAETRISKAETRISTAETRISTAETRISTAETRIRTLENHNVGATVVETYRNGTEWYRVWSDGWVEQGGQLKWSSVAVPGAKKVTLYKAMANKNYNTHVEVIKEKKHKEGNFGTSCFDHTTTSFWTYSSGQHIDSGDINSDSSEGLIWFACGQGA